MRKKWKNLFAKGHSLESCMRASLTEHSGVNILTRGRLDRVVRLTALDPLFGLHVVAHSLIKEHSHPTIETILVEVLRIICPLEVIQGNSSGHELLDKLPINRSLGVIEADEALATYTSSLILMNLFSTK